MIGGPSAGGSMALATMLALTNTSKLGGVIMTGTINPDSTIGPVGGVLAKAETAYRAGFNTFLVPPTQSLYYSLGLEPLNLSEYALDNWDLSVVEVASLEEAFRFFTGFRVEREEVSLDVVTQDYDGLAGFMAQALSDNLKSLNAELHSKFAESKVSFSIGLEVSEALNDSDMAVQNVSEFFENGDYYVAASKALQESINTLYASYLINYDAASSKTLFVKGVLEGVYDSVRFFSNNTNYSRILDNVYDLELVVASLDRLREAEAIISEAYEAYYSTDLRGALFLAATASERLETARVWLNSTDYLSGQESFVFNSSRLSSLASSSLSDASTAITYASTLVSASLIAGLSRELDEVTDFFIDGKYARTIFESLSLTAEANLLMEVRGLDADLLSRLFALKRDNVVRLISREEGRGALPILAISYLLYADYFFEVEDLSNALRYLNYAAQYSSLSSSVFKAVTGEPPVKVSEGFALVRDDFAVSEREGFAFFFLGMIAASILFLVAVSFRSVIS
jgi:uncharacterized protein